jgi:hypothetical protein
VDDTLDAENMKGKSKTITTEHRQIREESVSRTKMMTMKQQKGEEPNRNTGRQ